MACSASPRELSRPGLDLSDELVVLCADALLDGVKLRRGRPGGRPDVFPARSLAQIRRYRRGLGTFKVDWALDGPVPWLAEECRRAGVVHVGDSFQAMSKAVWEAFYGLLPAQPTLILGQQSLADPSRAPTGKHTLWGYTHVPTWPVGDALQPKRKPTGPGRPSRSRTGWKPPSRSTPPASAS